MAVHGTSKDAWNAICEYAFHALYTVRHQLTDPLCSHERIVKNETHPYPSGTGYTWLWCYQW
jgi:hypothetical protein